MISEGGINALQHPDTETVGRVTPVLPVLSNAKELAKDLPKGSANPTDDRGSLLTHHSPLEGESQKPSREATAEAVGGVMGMTEDDKRLVLCLL